MGRGRSSDSDSDAYSRSSRKKKKEKRRRSRSRSASSNDSSRYQSSRSSRKSKKSSKHSSHRPSISPDRQRGRGYSKERSRRSRSRSAERRTSRRSRSPEKRSYKSRSRSYSRDRRRSRSDSRGRGRSRSGSASRSHTTRSGRRSRSGSKGHDSRRLRSSSRGRNDRRSRSGSRGYGSSSRTKSDRHRGRRRSRSKSSSRGTTDRSRHVSPKLEQGQGMMSSSEKAEVKMRKALLAAAAADEKLRTLRDQGLSSSPRSSPSHRTTNQMSELSLVASMSASKDFANSVASIDSGRFVQSSFKSGGVVVKEELPDPLMSSHDDAIFGSLSSVGFTIKPDVDSKQPVAMDADSIMNPSLYCDAQDKMERWIDRLSHLRRRKIEGEVMH